MMIDKTQYKVLKCNRKEIEKFIEKYHYSGSINGVKDNFCFKLVFENKIIGAALFGFLAMEGTYKKYVSFEKDLIELRRLCLIDETPKNTESYFISRCLKWINQNTSIKKIISYADPNYNHEGIIYKASNFQYLGLTQPTKIILFEGKKYHDKTIRTKYNNELKPFAKKIKEALKKGKAQYIDQKPKHIYLYSLKKKRQWNIIYNYHIKSKSLETWL